MPRYYMLEIVNLIYQDTASEAFEVLFSFWDALDDRMKLDGVGTEYFYQLCQLFMLAHQELIPRMMEELEKSYLKSNPPKSRTSAMEMWQLRQQARMQAEEIVMNEIVMKFH